MILGIKSMMLTCWSGKKKHVKRDRHRFTDRQKADTRKIQLHQQIQFEGFYDKKDTTIDENRVIFK